jgi:glycerol-3-phosphate dehydrogenase
VAENERYRMLDQREMLALEPRLRADQFYGAGLYYEYLTDDARLVIEVVKSAVALGAVAANYAEVGGFLIENGRVGGVSIRDQLSGDALSARGRVVINAAGPWVDAVRLLSEPGDRPRLRLTKGIHLGIRTERIGLSHIVVMNARDKRGVFAIPRGRVTYLGTTDTDYPRPEDYPDITHEDVEYLLDAANRTFVVDPPLQAEDVVSAWAGLRPLLQQEGKKPSELSRKDEIMIGASGLISIAGGKLTTFRRMSERVVDLACERLRETGAEAPARKGTSEETLLGSGATGDDTNAFTERLRARWPRVPAAIVERLVALYGSNAERLVDGIAVDPVLAERFAPHLAVTRAEVEYAVREEMAMTLEDFMERRARLLLWEPDNGLSIAEGVARAMGAVLGWDAGRVRDEAERYRVLAGRLKQFDHGTAAEVGGEAAAAAHG